MMSHPLLSGRLAPARATRSFLLGAHYFGAHDPISFWAAFRPEDMQGHFKQIRADGFDTILLVLPWHALFADLKSDRMDRFYADRLQRLLAAADAANLRVVSRLFYNQSPDKPAPDTHERQYALLLRQNPPWITGQAMAMA